MNSFHRFFLLFVSGVFLFTFSVLNVVMAEEADQSAITGEELIKAHALALSKDVEYGERIKIARSLSLILEKMDRSRNARRFCLDFYASVSTMLQNDWEPDKAPVLAAPYTQFADAIEQGKRLETITQMHDLIRKTGSDNPEPVLGILSLKADDMPTAYGVFFTDLADSKISASSYYMLGLLAARESRMVEAERFMEKAKGGLGAPMLERWLTIDLIKISIVNNRIEGARSEIDALLEKNPKDARALSMMIFSNLQNGNKDLARQQLSRLVPLLFEDPYLLAETAKLAIELKELNIAASVLEKFEAKVESNRDFYRVFAAVRKMQGKSNESTVLMNKANQIPDTRVLVSSKAPSVELSEAIKETETNNVEGLDSLATVYLLLLDGDVSGAIQELKKTSASNSGNGYERFFLSTIQRRNGLLKDAVETLKSIRKDYPTFRPYQVLSLLADLTGRIGAGEEATSLYQELIRQFPGSRQADVAERFLKSSTAALSIALIYPVEVSSLISRYSQYAAPFVLTEIQNYWGDRVSFASINSMLGTSPGRGLTFSELGSVISNMTRYQAVPFNGKAEAVLEFLNQQIPVVFCRGEMFLSQTLTELSIVTGANPATGQFYAEGITLSDPYLITEADMLEGICVAVYPTSIDFKPSPVTAQCIQLGKEYIQLCKDALAIENNPDFDSSRFIKRRDAVLKETLPVYLPMQLAFARWVSRNKTYNAANKYLKDLEAMGQNGAHYWFLCAYLQNRKNPALAQTILDRALKIAPDTSRYSQAKALVMMEDNQLDKAIAYMENLRTQYPESPIISSHLLLLYGKTGNTQKKEEETNRLKKYFNVESIRTDLDLPKDSN